VFFGSSTVCAIGEALFILGGLWELPLYYGFVLGGYATSTHQTCVGLWRMQRRALTWFRAWMLMCIPLWAIAIAVLDLGLTGAALITLVHMALFLVLNRYIAGAVGGGDPGRRPPLSAAPSSPA
jgi:hypothetical protein